MRIIGCEVSRNSTKILNAISQNKLRMTGEWAI